VARKESGVNIWLLMAGMGAATLLLRLSFFILPESMPIPHLLRRALRFIPPVVLSAIVLPDLLYRSGRLDIAPTNPRLLAGAAAAFIAWRTKSAFWTIVLGMAALLAFQALLTA
jgi:branched-subunit amino acid transport protein